MKRHIHFADIAHLLEKTDCRECTQDIFDQAVNHQKKVDLRFDNATGVIRDNSVGELERYSNQSDFTPHTCAHDVLTWEFKRHVNNSISRLQRGFSA